MKIAIIGTGYVGLVSGACISEIGSEVVCIDNNEAKISSLEQGQIPIYEPGLEEIVTKNVAAGKLSFSTDLKSVIGDVDGVFLAVGTPSDENGKADLSFVFSALDELAKCATKDIMIVTKSTVPVGTGKKIKDFLQEKRPDINFDIVSNPEFLREGCAVDDFLNPDRIVVGIESNKAKAAMEEIYSQLMQNNVPILFTKIPTAEMIKYASNAFLATKISFANEMADICEAVDADITEVIQGMGMDQRIGARNMNPGPGFGGSCFPKDTLALKGIGIEYGAPTKIVEAVIESNDARKVKMADKVVKASGGDIRDKVIAIWGVTFKANTDDMRYSPSLSILPKLSEQGAHLRIYDPIAMDEAVDTFAQSNNVFCQNALDAVNGADIIVIITEWDEFKNIDISDIKDKMRGNIIVDLRNIIDGTKASKLGLHYHSIGR